MAGNYDELQAVLKELLTNRFAPKPEYTRGLLGDGQGNVTVPGRPDKNYVRFNRGSTEFFQIFNVTVPAVNDWPVLIGELPWLPGLTQVVGTDWASYEQSGWGDNLGDTSPHAPTHEWPDGNPGADPVNIYLRSIVPLRAYSLGTGSTTIYVNSYEYENTNGSGTVWGGLPGVDMQPVMSSLSTGTARLMGIYLNPGTNQLGVVTGASDIFTDASDPPSPQFPRGVIPVARIRTYGGQASIGEIDIRDARQPFGWIPTGTASAVGGWPFTNKIHTVDPDGNADYTTIQDAHDNASAGDAILFSGNTGEDVSISKSITLQGFNSETSVLNSLDISVVTGVVYLKSFKAANTDAGGTNSYAITTDHTTIADNVIAIANGSNTSGNNAGWRITDGSGHILRNCEGRGLGNDTNNYGFMADTASSDVRIIGGQFSGTGGNFNADITTLRTDINIELQDAQCLNSTLRITGGLTGSAKTNTGEDAGFIINNSPSASVQMDAGVVGYIDANGDFDTTTSASVVVEWVVVTVGNAALGKPAFVKNKGIATINYTGSAPSDGDFLTTSTVAGSALARSTMHPAIFARCLEAGSGGKVKVLLLTQTKHVFETSNNRIFDINPHSDTKFEATINGAPTATSVVYNVPSAGSEDAIVPTGANLLAKQRLHNTTRGTYRLISAVNTGTNTITTVSSSDSWASGDNITIESQTVTFTPADYKMVDLDLSQQTEIPELARGIMFRFMGQDTGTPNDWYIHPFEAFDLDKASVHFPPVANKQSYTHIEVHLIEQCFCYSANASGAGTAVTFMTLVGYAVASP